MISQFVKFSLVGVVNTILHYSIFYLLFSFVGVYHLLASTIGFCFAVVNSYLINRHWTFKSKNSAVREEFTRFFVVSLTALMVNLISMAFLVELFFWHPPLAQLAAIVLTLVVNFLGNKFWSFKSI